MWKKQIQPGDKVPLKLTPTETKAILEELVCLDRQHEQAIQKTSAGKPVMMTLAGVEDFAGYVAAEANHTEDKKLERKLDRVFEKCQRLLDTYTDEPDDAISAEQAKQNLTKGITDAFSGKEPATIPFRLKSKTPKAAKFPVKFTQHQRDSLLLYTRPKAAIKKRVESAEEGTQIIEFTKKELDQMLNEIGHAVVYARSPHKQRLAAIRKKVDDILEEIQLEEFGLERPKQRRRPPNKSELLIQLKLSLLETMPTIWRRIQIKDCTLGELHDHIQTAMGWENCHMHEFIIEAERFGAAMSDDFGFGEETKDESRFRLSDFLPKTGKRFRFQYIYDFGDDWQHEILFEGYPPIDEKLKYPLCVEGERACPPEDVGGPWGYAEYLNARADPNHERHEDFMEWSGAFDADKFSIEKVTREMRKTSQ